MDLETVAHKDWRLTQQVQRLGKTRSGTQRYRCGDCQRTFVAFYTQKACDPAVQVQLTQMAINGAGVRDTARVLKISQNTVSSQIKKAIRSYKSTLRMSIKASQSGLKWTKCCPL